MERSFRCPECQTIVTVPLHVFPVCPSCGYSRHGEPRHLPAHAEWAVAGEADAPAEWHAEGAGEAAGGEGGLADAGAEGAEGTGDAAQWQAVPAETRRASPLGMALLVIGAVILLAGVVLVVMSLAAVKSAPAHSDLYGLIGSIVGLIVLFAGVFVNRRKPTMQVA